MRALLHCALMWQAMSLVPAARGIDFYNAQSVETREPLSYDQVVKE